MKVAGHLMLPGEGERVRLAPGWLRVEGSTIAEVVEGDIPGDADAGGEGCVICPGFVDAHMHLPQFGIIGAHGLGLLDWLERVTFPAERRWADAEAARADAERAMRRMLRCGTTGFAAYATVHAAGARAALETAERLGMRAHIGQVLMDRGAPRELCRPREQLLAETAELLDAYPPSGDAAQSRRVSAAVTPRFAPACTAELLSGTGELAGTSGALVQTHLAETRAECELVRELFGDGYTAVYRDAGLLGPRTVLGHGIYLKDDDHALLAEAGSTVAHCPTANSFLMSGRFDHAATRAGGVRVALGSDIGAGYEVSMVRVARAMLETAGALCIDDPARSDATLPGAAGAWWQVTAGNAAALGWVDGGRLAPGCVADLAILRPTIGWRSNAVHDALAALLWAWDDRWLASVWLAGRAVEVGS